MVKTRLRVVREYGLTAGTLGSTSAQTIMVALLPVLLAEYAPSAVWIGFVIGGEGLFALLVPYWIGHLSDHLPRRWARRIGRRTFFLVATAPIMAASLALVPFVDGYWALAAIAFIFFSAFHGYLTPLWALMVDAVPGRRHGRVHGVRGALHAAGLGYGLVAGGLLFAVWEPLPFLVAALLVLAMTVVTVASVPPAQRREAVQAEPDASSAAAAPQANTATVDAGGSAGQASDDDRDDDDVPPGSDDGPGVWRTLLERDGMRWFLIANALWTGAVDGIRPYVFPFAMIVLGISVAETSAILTILLAAIAIGTVLLGRLGDRYGRARLLEAGAVLTAIAMALGVLVRDVPGAALLLLAAGVGAAALIALPYPIFASLLGNRAVGRFTGLYILSMGLARVVAPVLVGAAIDFGAVFFPALEGYPLMWPIAGVMAATSVIALRRAVAAAPALRGGR